MNGVWANKGGLIMPIASFLLSTRCALKHTKGTGVLVRCLHNFLSPNRHTINFRKGFFNMYDFLFTVLKR